MDYAITKIRARVQFVDAEYLEEASRDKNPTQYHQAWEKLVKCQ